MDEFEARIRAARPASVRRDTPLNSRAKRELAELILSDPEYSSSLATRRESRLRRRRKQQVAGGTFATLLVAAAAVVAVVVSQPVHAHTPALLATEAVSITAQEALSHASAVDLETVAAPGDGEAPNPDGAGVISLQTWTLSSSDDGSEVTSAIVPENYVITRGEDGARTVVVTAGRSQRGDGSDVGGGGVEEGALLWEESYPAGEYAYAFASAAPTSAGDVRGFLSAVAGTDTSASAAIQAITILLMEQTLTPAQEATLLDYLATLPDIEMVGQATDRLGRPAFVLSAQRGEGEYADSILISSEQGTILAVETIYTGSGRSDVPSPAVVRYYAWNRN